MRFTVVTAVLLLAALLVSLALPVETWRTGDQRLALLDSAPEAAAPTFPRRLWIDTDAACGEGRTTDPDDCLAIALLAHAPDVEIVGISTVAGNAPLDAVDRTTRELAALLSAETDRTLRVHSGPRALQTALEAGPLTILALGPLTNLAAVLDERPGLAGRVARLVAVMGRRPGHIFHPAEGAQAGILFGHGPVFRDFNFALDSGAASRVLAAELPTSFVPYDAARGMEITATDLDRLATLGGGRAWVSKRTRAWLDYWRTDIGRSGFYPFDLLAAAYVLEPSWFRCTPVRAWVGEDRTLFIPFRWQAALLVSPEAPPPQDETLSARALYCSGTRGNLKADVLQRLTKLRRAAASVRRTPECAS